jgi:ABC-type Mn2+/Zn2+ transport system permease subunit
VIATAWSALSDPWGQEIMRRAFAEVVLLGIAGGVLGAWIVLFGLSYATESIAHGLLPGLVVAALVGLPLLAGAAGGALVAAVAIAAAARVPTVGRDTAIAVAVTALFGLGALLALSPDTPAGLSGLLFGDVLGVSDGDLWAAGALAAVVLGLTALLRARLLLVGFDRANARALGAAPGVVDLLVLVLVAAAVVVAVQGLGSLLVVAVLVAPAAAARLTARRLGTMLVAGTAVAVGAGIGGLYLSYYADTAAGASIAGMLVLAYAGLALTTRRSAGTIPAA